MPMQINYYRDDENATTYAVATAHSFLPGGMEPSVAYGLVQRHYIAPKDVSVPMQMRSKSKPHGSDTYDRASGDAIARDKLLVRYYEKVGASYDAYIAALEKELERARGNKAFAASKVANATERLKKFDD